MPVDGCAASTTACRRHRDRSAQRAGQPSLLAWSPPRRPRRRVASATGATNDGHCRPPAGIPVGRRGLAGPVGERRRAVGVRLGCERDRPRAWSISPSVPMFASGSLPISYPSWSLSGSERPGRIVTGGPRAWPDVTSGRRRRAVGDHVAGRGIAVVVDPVARDLHLPALRWPLLSSQSVAQAHRRGQRPARWTLTSQASVGRCPAPSFAFTRTTASAGTTASYEKVVPVPAWVEADLPLVGRGSRPDRCGHGERDAISDRRRDTPRMGLGRENRRAVGRRHPQLGVVHADRPALSVTFRPTRPTTGLRTTVTPLPSWRRRTHRRGRGPTRSA